jgi:exodeoxyribonuclease-3
MLTASEDPPAPEGKPRSTDITVMSWNANGIRSLLRKGEFFSALARENPDILVVSETRWAWNKAIRHKGFLSTLREMGYVSVTWHQCLYNPGYSGVAVISKIRPRSVTKGLDDMRIDKEGRVVTLEFDKFILIGSYVPCSGGNFVFDEKRKLHDRLMVSHMENLRKKFPGKPVIYTGDLNVAERDCDVWNGISNPEEARKIPGFGDGARDRFTAFRNKFLLQDAYVHFREEERKQHYTFYQNKWDKKKNKGFRLDYCLADRQLFRDNRMYPGGNAPFIDGVTVVRRQGGSDHFPIKFHIRNGIDTDAPPMKRRNATGSGMDKDGMSLHGRSQDPSDIEIGPSCLDRPDPFLVTRDATG